MPLKPWGLWCTVGKGDWCTVGKGDSWFTVGKGDSRESKANSRSNSSLEVEAPLETGEPIESEELPEEELLEEELLEEWTLAVRPVLKSLFMPPIISSKFLLKLKASTT